LQADGHALLLSTISGAETGASIRFLYAPRGSPRSNLYARISITGGEGDPLMLDLIYLLLGTVSFAACALFVHACARI
jgi:hypothetical protein